MIYSFNRVDAPKQPLSPLFLLNIQQAASQALGCEELSHKDAWALCEYLDLVDAGDMEMERAMYRQAVAALGEFMATPDNRGHSANLQRKSWAANTLGKLLPQTKASVLVLRAA